MRQKSGLDYYTFGAPMPGRNANPGDYRYGFNDAEKDDEITGSAGTDYDLGARMYDSRLGRMFSTDPLQKNYSWQSPYAYCKNRPVSSIDVKGEGDGDPVGGIPTQVPSGVQGTDYNYYPMTPAELRDLNANNGVNSLGMQIYQFQTYGYNGATQPTLYWYEPSAPLVTGGAGSSTFDSPRTNEQIPVKEATVTVDVHPVLKVATYTPPPSKPRGGGGGGLIVIPNVPTPTLNIEFYGNSDLPMHYDAAKAQVQPLIDYMKKYPSVNIVLTGNTGTDEGNPYNEDLGTGPSIWSHSATLNYKPATLGVLMTARAQAVADIAIRGGIDAKRITTQPGTHSGSPAGRTVGVSTK